MSFESDQVLALVDEGLGNSCYLVVLTTQVGYAVGW